MSARDELTRLIESGYGTDESPCPYEHGPVIAEAVLAAGYRKPRTITSIAELDETISRSFEDGENLVLMDRWKRPWIIWSDEDGDECVSSWPQEEDPERLSLNDISFPATVLHEPVAS